MNEQTIADAALFGIGNNKEPEVNPNVTTQAPKVEQSKVENPTPEPTVSAPVVNSRYLPGSYRSEKFMRIIKKITFEHTKDENNKIQKTHGTWANPKNMIIFRKGDETVLTAEDLELPSIQRLIDSKTIYRVG